MLHRGSVLMIKARIDHEAYLQLRKQLGADNLPVLRSLRA